MSRGLRVAAALLLAGVCAAEAAPSRRPGRRPRRAAPAARALDEEARWADAARRAWAFVAVHTSRQTGLVDALAGYPFVTAWDIGSTLAALRSAYELGLVDEARYREQMGRLLATLRRVPLFRGVAFNKSYNTRRATMAGRLDRDSDTGEGWSALDLGRLLLWLKIVAVRDPSFAEAAAAVAGRLDAGRVVRDGELWGAQLRADGTVEEYQEGRIGYEQYAARGFAAWGHAVGPASDPARAGVPIRLMGRTLLADLRGRDRLTNEPFVLSGLETGWTSAEEPLARALLEVQEERFRRTRQVTMPSEDAIPRPPHYFYYYCVYANGRAFETVVQTGGAVIDGPRWVSAKAAFAWAALAPGDYTRRAVGAVAAARTARGWASGVYEGSGRSTGGVNLNTQAVILEAALYRKLGRPLIEQPGSGVEGEQAP